MSTSLMSNYARLPVEFTHGEGAWLWDSAGTRYLDALGGIAVCGLGHAHPAVRDALCEQAGRLLHTSNIYGIPLQRQLADRLTALSGMENAFFCNSGTEANEAAIKLARFYASQQGIKNPQILVTERSFHGRTMGALSATGNSKLQAGFEPLLEGFVRIPYNDVDAVRSALRDNPAIVAMLVEPLQGEGGVNIPAVDYLKQLRILCDEHGKLLMLDEVQTGIARTGAWFAFQHNAIVPDVLCLAKGLGNGVPVGACLARGEAAACLQPGSHGSTFGGNPLACRAALAVLETIEKEQLVARVERLGQILLQGFQNNLGDLPAVVDIRGKGLMLGIELDKPCGDLVKQALDRHLLINVTAGNTVRLLPPFIISDEQAGEILTGVSDLVRGFCA